LFQGYAAFALFSPDKFPLPDSTLMKATKTPACQSHGVQGPAHTHLPVQPGQDALIGMFPALPITTVS
jgi:hypothetical protein